MMEMWGPIGPDHPCVGLVCGACRRPLAAGDKVTLFPLGPADEDDARDKAAGRPYTEAAVPVHWACVSEVRDREEGEAPDA